MPNSFFGVFRLNDFIIVGWHLIGLESGRSLVDELIAKRRVESAKEEAEASEWELRTLGIEICAFNEVQAISSGLLRKQTRAKGPSLGDRACLSLAMELQAVVLTGDKAWKELNLPIEIVDIRAG